MEKFPDDENDKQFITGITGKKNFSIVTVAKSGMSSEVGFLRKVLEVFEKYGVSVEYVPSGIDSVSVVVASKAVSDCLYAIMGDLQKTVKPDSINVTEDIAIVAVVGRKMAYKPGMSGRLFAALGESKINIRMISQSCEELNIIAGVSNEDFEKAVKVLYSSFVKK
jgi:aspartate kinase